MGNNKRYYTTWQAMCMPRIFFLISVILTLLSGCRSMQKDLIRSDMQEYRDLAELEETIVKLDGAGADMEELIRARRQILSLEENEDSGKSSAGAEYTAILAAWSGRLYLMEGKNSAARQKYLESHNLSPVNIPSLILYARIENEPARRLSFIDRSLENYPSSGELFIERGRVLFDLSRFSESAAAFDTAFTFLREKPCYENAYTVFRDKALELYDMERLAYNTAQAINPETEITWKDLIEITKTQTNLLNFIGAGKNLPADVLFKELIERSFIPLTQDVDSIEWPFSEPPLAESVRRSGAAWFLWRLYAEKQANRGLLTMYSSRMANTPNARSPVADIDIWSPFLDSVMGCMENFFMYPPDMRNFMPNEKVKSADFLSMIKKLEAR